MLEQHLSEGFATFPSYVVWLVLAEVELLITHATDDLPSNLQHARVLHFD